MFRNWYKGISQDKHLKQKQKTQRFRSMTKRVKLFCTLRSGELSFLLGSVVEMNNQRKQTMTSDVLIGTVQECKGSMCCRTASNCASNCPHYSLTIPNNPQQLNVLIVE